MSIRVVFITPPGQMIAVLQGEIDFGLLFPVLQEGIR